MTKFLALTFLFLAFAFGGSVSASYTLNPESNCVADGTAINFQSSVSSSFQGGSNTLTYVHAWSVDGGATSALAQPSCPATTASVVNLLCNFPTTNFPGAASFIDLTYNTRIFRNAGNQASAGDTFRFWELPTLSISKTDASCAGNDGSIQFTVTAGFSGHFAAWTYSVNGGASVALPSAGPVTVSGLAPGAYSVTITNTDGSDCHVTSATVTVGSPYIPTFTAQGTNPSCPGLSDGSILVTVTNNPGGVSFQYSKDDGATWEGSGTSYTFTSLAAATYKIKVRTSSGSPQCGAGPTAVTLTAPVPPTWTVEYDCSAEKLVFSGAGVGSLTQYNVNGGAFVPITTSSGPLADSETPYTVVVKYGTCQDSKDVTVDCVHHCALSPGYWKNQGNWFNNPCQYFGTATWCSWTYNSLLTTIPSSISADSRAKFIAGRQYVAFILTMYYYSDPKVDVRSYTVAQLVELGIPQLVAEAAVALNSCSLTPSEYSQYGSVLSVFNSHVVDEVYVENVECDPKISAPSCPSKRSLVQQLHQKK